MTKSDKEFIEELHKMLVELMLLNDDRVTRIVLDYLKKIG